MKKIISILSLSLMFSFTSLYAEVDGYKDYKFGMSIEEVDAILKHKCKGNYEIRGDRINNIVGEPCFSIAGFKPDSERFGFVNNKLEYIQLRLNFTNDKAKQEKEKEYNIIYHLIKKNDYAKFTDKISKALKKKYGYTGELNEKKRNRTWIAFGNGQIILKLYNSKDWKEYILTFNYLSSNQAKEMLIELGMMKKKMEDDL
jgi:hypothetical protein